MRTAVGLTFAIGLALSACGSSGGDAETSSSATNAEPEDVDISSLSTDPTTSEPSPSSDAPATSESSASEQDLDADLVAAQAAVLTLADFPSGWSELATSDDASDAQDELNRARAECFGGSSEGLLEGDARAETDEFVSPDEVTVSQVVLVTASDDEAVALFEGFVEPEVPTCLAEVYNDQIDNLLADAPAGTEVGEITVGALNVTPVGDEATALRVTVPVSADGLSVEVVLDLVLTRSGRTLSGLSFESTFAPVPIELLEEYSGLAASRLPGATSNQAPTSTSVIEPTESSDDPTTEPSLDIVNTGSYALQTEDFLNDDPHVATAVGGEISETVCEPPVNIDVGTEYECEGTAEGIGAVTFTVEINDTDSFLVVDFDI